MVTENGQKSHKILTTAENSINILLIETNWAPLYAAS